MPIGDKKTRFTDLEVQTLLVNGVSTLTGAATLTAATTPQAPILAGSTLAVTAALHNNKVILLDQAAGSVCTLPAASGSGAQFSFSVFVLATSNSHIVKVANSTDIMVGTILSMDGTTGTVSSWGTVAASDTVTLNRSTTGSVRIGESFTLTDIKTGFWAITGNIVTTGTAATPFSATV